MKYFALRATEYNPDVLYILYIFVFHRITINICKYWLKYQISLIVSTKMKWSDGCFHWFCSLILCSFGWRFRFIFLCQSRLAPCCAQCPNHTHKPIHSLTYLSLIYSCRAVMLFVCLIFGVQCTNSMLSALFEHWGNNIHFNQFWKQNQKKKNQHRIHTFVQYLNQWHRTMA